MRTIIRHVFFLNLLSALAGFPLHTMGQQVLAPQEARRHYRLAERFYNLSDPTDATDSQALHSYLEAIALYRKAGARDSILRDCYFKAAIFEQTAGRYAEALPLLKTCLQLADSLPGIPEQDQYLPALYAGNSYYFLNRYDSARYYFRQAEGIASRHPGISGLERLYNTLGVLNFETGNYRQSRNYFERAIQTLHQKKPVDEGLLVGFQSNLATSLRKLNEYGEALKIYQDLLHYHLNTDELYQNIAAVYIGTGNYPQALNFLSRVKKADLNKFNNLALAYVQLHRYDSARYFIRQAIVLNQQQNKQLKNLAHGLTFRYLGDLFSTGGQADSALHYYQAAIRQMIYHFNNWDIRENPAGYTGVFSVAELYETLLHKAMAFEKRHQKSGDRKDLQSALDCYQSLFKLSDYAGKTYGSDEARMALNLKNYQIHDQPIRICLQLYKQTGDRRYEQAAFVIDERNKASVLTANIYEQELKKALHIPDSLLSAESDARDQINRLNLLASQVTDSGQADKYQRAMHDEEIRLDAIQLKFQQYPEYEKLHFQSNTASPDAMSDSVIPSGTAILSYHRGEKSLLIWCLRRGKWQAFEQPVTDSFFLQIRELKEGLQNPGMSSLREIRQRARYLYQVLIAPAESALAGIRSLVIVPDDEINFIPFEMLVDGHDKYLLRRFSISYSYSCTLLKEQGRMSRDFSRLSVLALAPFAGSSSSPAAGNQLPQLPYSAQEVGGLKGKILEGSAASKTSFLQLAPDFGILHLATHALADGSDPLRSFIAFYPAHPDSPALDKLFIPEIYQLHLPHTKLAILSACETGTGELIHGEGLISLSRAFSYAGCPNTLTSLWKADDRATAYISARLHHYLKKGDGPAEALRQAKLDYLDDDQIEARFKSPAYWAALRLAGPLEQPKPPFGPDLFLLLPVLLLGIYWLARKKKGK